MDRERESPSGAGLPGPAWNRRSTRRARPDRSDQPSRDCRTGWAWPSGLFTTTILHALLISSSPYPFFLPAPPLNRATNPSCRRRAISATAAAAEAAPAVRDGRRAGEGGGAADPGPVPGAPAPRRLRPRLHPVALLLRVPLQEGVAQPVPPRQGHHVRAQGEGGRHGHRVALAHLRHRQGLHRQARAPAHVRRAGNILQLDSQDRAFPKDPQENWGSLQVHALL